MTPGEKRRHYAAERVANAAVKLSEGLTAVEVRTKRLEQVLRNAADQGVPMYEAEAMTKDLNGIGVAGMIRRAYLGDDKFEVTGRDTVMYCLAHRRKVTWLPLPGWWIHDDGRPSTGNGSDPRGCAPMWNAPAPLTTTRKASS
jgi:hypothetical protein